MDYVSKKENEKMIKVKYPAASLGRNLIKLLKVLHPTKILPIEADFCDIEEKINNTDDEFTDTDDCSTVALSLPNSFSSVDTLDTLDDSNVRRPFIPSKFNMISVLGSGSFGTVFLSEYESQHYALKRLPKNEINEYEMEQIMEEKKALEKMAHPFVLKFYGTCQTNDELYFITEVINCGDLFMAIHDGERLSHEECVFYAAGILLGLTYIHSKNIIFRDLKPENVMIGSNGYPKIIDFGLAKQLPYVKMSDEGVLRNYSKCYTLCGTPEYIAPELILKRGCDTTYDIWAFGVLLYEMICRITPFVDDKSSKDVMKLFSNIVLAAKSGIDVSKKVDKKTDGTINARDLITQLLSGDKDSRLGKSELIQHPYFLSTGLSMTSLYEQTIPAPITHDEFIGSPVENARPVTHFDANQAMFADF
jgi:protein kinase A